MRDMQQRLTAFNSNKDEQFKSWVLAYSDILYSHSILRGFDRDEAKDLVQDTFLSAWKNFDHFEGKASVKNWLFVILKNKITDHMRKISSRPRKENLESSDYFFDDNGHWAKSAFPKELMIDPSNPNDINDFYQIFEGCSSKLNKMQKAVFLMKYVDDMESETICGELSISANNYWTILHRAKVQLRACLEKNWLIKSL